MNTISIRYIVSDVDGAIAFYTGSLDFEVDMHPAPSFVALKRGSLRLLLNAPGAGGAGTAMPDGMSPQPGGWNRFQLEVDDLDSTVKELASQGASFRGEIVEGKGGRQILVEDPSGNPVELFESRRSIV